MGTTRGWAGAILLAAALAFAQPSGAAPAGEGTITLEVTAPQPGAVFACRIPVSIRHPETLELEQLDAIAKAYRGRDELSSTGIATGDRPLIRHRENGRLSYEPVPLQFDLTEEVCEAITTLRLVYARCKFSDGIAVDCLDRLRFEPQAAGDVRFLVGEP